MFKEKKKNNNSIFLTQQRCQTLASSHLSALSQLRTAEISSLHQTGWRGCSQLSVTQVGDPLTDQGLAASCPVPSPFLGFEHIFKLNDTSGGVGKLWATVFLGPYLSCRTQNLPKDSSLHPRIDRGYGACPGLRRTPGLGREGVGRGEKCRSHHQEWGLNKGQGQCQRGRKKERLLISLSFKVETFICGSKWSYFTKMRVKALPIFLNLNRHINQDSLGTQNKGCQGYQRTIVPWMRERNYTQELVTENLEKVKIQGKNPFFRGKGI